MQARLFLQAIAVLLVYWIILRAMKYYVFAEGTIISRYIWYLYYVSMLGIPLLSLFVALSLGKSDHYRLPKWTNIFLGFASAYTRAHERHTSACFCVSAAGYEFYGF